MYFIGIFAFIFILGLIILVHEGGHFFFAKKAGILCHEFSLGMGPVVWQSKKGETAYSIRAIPIGGYVSMAGEEVEADLLKGKTDIRIDVRDNRIVRFILDPKLKAFQELPLVTIMDYDLIGTKEARPDELYLHYRDEEGKEDTLTVARNAIAVFNQKQAFQIAPYDRTFTNKPLGARFRSVIAGPVMNFVLAFVLFLIVGFAQGQPDFNSTVVDSITEKTPVYGILVDHDRLVSFSTNNQTLANWNDVTEALASLQTTYLPELSVTVRRNNEDVVLSGIHPQLFFYSIGLASDYKVTDKVIVGDLSDGSFAEKAGLKVGDEIKEITKKTDNATPITVSSWQDVMNYFNDPANLGPGLTLKVVRGDSTLDIPVAETWDQQVLSSNDLSPVDAKIGISPLYKFNPVKSFTNAFVQTGDACLLIFRSLGLLFTSKQVGLDDFSGFVGIYDLTSKMAAAGFLNLLNWAAILSVNVGFLNIMPLPALDGGRLAFLGYEAVTKKRPNAKVENTIHTIGFVLLMLLFVFVTWNDILRLLGLK